jgi:CheY-like chemotaxis protein
MEPGQRRAILVVDDQPRLLTVVADMCEALGYRVLRALDGEAALRLIHDGIDLLVTDVRMPGLDGLDLLRRVRAERPALPVVVMTGYPDAPNLAAMSALGIVGVLWRPFALPELKAKIDQAWLCNPPASADAPTRPLRILVVDDEPMVRQAFQLTLEAKGHRVALAEDARAAIRRLSQDRFDLIFLDVRLPDFSGAEVLKDIKRLDAETPVVLVTGAPDHAETLAALDLGPAMLLRKPVRLKDLEAVLKTISKEQRASFESGDLRTSPAYGRLAPEALPSR